MPSLVHTCEGCGEHLSVADRYFGRPLRCPGCGEVFTVAPPTDGFAPAPPQAPAAPRASRRWWRWALAAIPLIGLVVWFSLPKDASSRLFSRQVFPGQVLIVAGEGTGPERFGAIDREQAGQLVDRAEGGASAATPPPSVVRIALGTRVSVVEHRKAERVVVARVLEGPWSGRTLWIPARWLE